MIVLLAVGRVPWSPGRRWIERARERLTDRSRRVGPHGADGRAADADRPPEPGRAAAGCAQQARLGATRSGYTMADLTMLRASW